MSSSRAVSVATDWSFSRRCDRRFRARAGIEGTASLPIDRTENHPSSPDPLDPADRLAALRAEDSRERRAEAAAEARDNRRYLLLFPAVAAVLILVALVAYWRLA